MIAGHAPIDTTTRTTWAEFERGGGSAPGIMAVAMQPVEQDESPEMARPRRGSLLALALLFLRLGCTSFGGPAAHIAMMEDEVVRRRRWMSHQTFMDLLGATNLIPGPNSTEMAIHIGWLVGGAWGLLLAGLCFILPAVLIITLLAWAYVQYGSLPQADALLHGIKPVVIAVVVQALWRLGRASVRTWLLSAVAIVAGVANLCGAHEVLVILASGLFVALLRGAARRRSGTWAGALGACGLPLAWWVPATATAATSTPFSLGMLFLFFLKVGSVLFGSGYVLIAFLRGDLVERWGWLTESQLLDAVAVGQATPGPLFTTATFIGYFLGGLPGATVATVGIFLPSFLLVALSAPWVPRLRRSPTAAAFLDGVNVGSWALMAVVAWQLGHAALVDSWSWLLALASALLLITTRLNSTWLIAAGALLGIVWG